MKKASSVEESALRPFVSTFSKRGLVEICINTPTELWLEFDTGEWKHERNADITESAMKELVTTFATISGQKFNRHNPSFSGRIPFKNTMLRVEAVMGSSVEGGFALSIRVGRASIYPLESYMSKSESDALKHHITTGKTLMVNGATGTGKTTLLNSIITHIPHSERILTIEDTRELIVPHPNVLHRLVSKNGTDEGKVDYVDIINQATRLRPDRILLGEIDIGNTMPFLKLCNTGHEGGLSTIHAADADQAFDTLCLNAGLAGVEGSKSDIEQYAKKAIHGFVSIKKTREGNKRVFRATLDMLNTKER